MSNRKNIISAVLILSFLFLFVHHTKKIDDIEKMEYREANSMVGEKLITTANMLFAYHQLNYDYFGKESIKWFTETMEDSIYKKSEEIKGEFQAVISSDFVFPEGLIVEMEKLVYQSLDAEMEKYSLTPPGEESTNIYLETTARLGAEEFEIDFTELKRLFPQLEQMEGIDNIWDAYREITNDEHTYNMFHVPLGGEKNIFICAKSYGGNNGSCFVEIVKWDGEKFLVLNRFDTQNAGWGRVICYEEEFFYVFLPYNYNLKNYDGIRLHRLGEKPEEETILIKYLPYDYVWENMYDNTQNIDLGESMRNYLMEIEGEITSPQYLEQGQNAYETFIGEEEEMMLPEALEANDGYVNTWYQIDFTNTGISVYLDKSVFTPSNTGNIWHLRTYFYLRNESRNMTLELKEAGTGTERPNRNKPILVQLWFKELQGKVYTFSLYHVSDYNYLLNVTLIEGRNVTRIRTDMLVPQRHFVLSKDIFYAGG